jgi:chromosome segregation ATPase
MFGPKKSKVSKKDLKKSIVNANDRLRAANTRMELAIEADKEKIESISKDYTAYKKALEDTKEMQVLANNELEGTQFEIAEAQTTVKEALSRFSKLTEETNSLEKSNKNLEDKSTKLVKSIALLQGKETELDNRIASLKQIKKEEADGQKTLELLAIELNELETGVEAYAARKSAAESEFRASKEKIEREKSKVLEELDNIKDRMAGATLACGKEMGRLDKAIAERISELQDLDAQIQKKVYHLSTIQASVSSVEERVKDAEQEADYIVGKAQEKVTRIKGDFKDWKVQALDEVARKKMKGQIDNIDKAGLKEVLNG